MAQIYNTTGIADLSAAHISTNLESYEAGRSAFFSLYVASEELKNLVKPTSKVLPENAEATDKYESVAATIADSLRLNVIKCPVPHFKVETAEFKRGNDTVRFATVPTFDGGQIVVDDIVGLDTKSILMAWLYAAYNPHTRTGGRMSEYKKSATLIEYTQDYEIVRKWKIEGIFVTGLTESEFDRENDSKRQITVDFTFDRAYVTDLGLGEPAAKA